MRDIKEEALNKWASILDHLGIDGDLLTGKHGPCPLCGGKDRFRFDNIDGRGTWICSRCGAGDGMHLLQLKRRWDFKEAAKQIRAVLGGATDAPFKPRFDSEAAKAAQRSLWMASAPISTDQAAAYLASRGLRGPYPMALRFCPSAEVTGHPSRSRMAAMVAMVSGPDGELVNLHRTYLESGRKARMESPRKLMPGPIPDGAAIRLAAHNGTLGIAEGIETALAVTLRFGVPCWAALNSTMLAKFIAPGGVTDLKIYGDNDPKFAGQAAAYRLAYRTATKDGGPAVSVHIPEIAGIDWADGEAGKAA